MTYRTKTVVLNTLGEQETLFNEVLSLKIGSDEVITVKIFKEMTPSLQDMDPQDAVLASGRLVVGDVTKIIWKRVAHELVLDSRDRLKKTVILLDAQYRYSKFTKMPRGKLEVVIAGGADLKFQNDSFNPVMEFRVGNQRVTVDE